MTKPKISPAESGDIWSKGGRIILTCLLVGVVGILGLKILRGSFSSEKKLREGPVTERTVMSRVFAIDRRYRAMEGPFDIFGVPMGSLLGNSPNSNDLWWFKGAKIELVDENGKLIEPEFMCHANIEFSPAQRKILFPSLDTGMYRLITFTQGCMEFMLPPGTGIPVSSQEEWSVTFQTLNFKRDGHFRAREKMTLYFIKDSDLREPLKALKQYTPYVTVALDGAKGVLVSNPNCPCCLPVPDGSNAPNNVPAGTFKSVDGQSLLTGHWVVPEGEHSWTTPLINIARTFPVHQTVTLHAAWAHVHPFCTELDLVEHKPGCQSQVVLKSEVQSKTGGKIGLVKIGDFSSEEGVKLQGDCDYELKIKYNNTSGKPVDSMGIFGLFLEDENWQKPSWVNAVVDAHMPRPAVNCGGPVPGSPGPFSGNFGGNFLSTGAPNVKGKSNVPDWIMALPMFDEAKDGPLEMGIVPIEITTTSGVLEAELRGDWAPKNVTQMKRLIASHAYENVAFGHRMPNYYCHTDPIDISGDKKDIVRRLPVEVKSEVRHETGVLSMANFRAPNSAIGPFSIILKSSPKLDGAFTVIGRLTKNPRNNKVMEALMSAPNPPVILKIEIKQKQPAKKTLAVD